MIYAAVGRTLSLTCTMRQQYYQLDQCGWKVRMGCGRPTGKNATKNFSQMMTVKHNINLRNMNIFWFRCKLNQLKYCTQILLPWLGRKHGKGFCRLRRKHGKDFYFDLDRIMATHFGGQLRQRAQGCIASMCSLSISVFHEYFSWIFFLSCAAFYRSTQYHSGRNPRYSPFLML